MLKKKIWVGFTVVLMMILTLNGYHLWGDLELDSTKISVDEQITLRMTIWGSSQLTFDKNAAVVKKFEESHPHIKVEIENYTADYYTEKLAIMAVSSNLPDIIRIDYSQIQNYARRGLLLPLDPYVVDNTIDLTNIDPLNTDSGKIDGVLYGLNIGNNAPVMFYNPELLAQAGIASPDDNYTWEQFTQDMQTINAKLGIYGDTHLGIQVFAVWLRQNGMKLYNEAQTELGYEDEKLFTDFFEMQLSWQKRGIISSLSEELEVKGLVDGPSGRGQAAFGSGLGYWSNQADTFVEALGHTNGYAMYPGSAGKKGMYIKPSFFHSISKKSKHPQEAAEFIEFYTNSLVAARELNGYFGIPYKPGLIEGMQDILSDTQKSIIQYMETVKEFSSPIDNPEPAGHIEVIKLYKNISEQIFFGEISTDQAARTFREQVNEVLQKQD